MADNVTLLEVPADVGKFLQAVRQMDDYVLTYAHGTAVDVLRARWAEFYIAAMAHVCGKAYPVTGNAGSG